jgi:glycosyltransferase involved in cell wall biosynthesis
MKKLLFVISQLYKGGAETALVNLLNTLDYTGYEVDLIILNQEPAGDGLSLINRINKSVNICDAYKEYQSIKLKDRIRAKLQYSMNQKGAYWFTALDFVKGKTYDWAFFWGEWCVPSFVAYHVSAKKKAAWIHSDIAKASFFNCEQYFYFDDCFDHYIFVSKNSMDSALSKFPFLKGKEVLVYNISDASFIREKSKEIVKDYNRPENKPVLITCANIREEKNHFRQIEVMAELKRRGIALQWINIGSTVEKVRVRGLKDKCKEENLEEDFLILGSKENPYKYMRQADMVAVLSDHESWSMVITEAKILGVPVIATRTSGALEQLEHGETGILTDFDVFDIADKIEDYLINRNKLNHIRQNLNEFDNTNEIISSFYSLLERDAVKNNNSGASLLYVIDDVNYMGGAHNATLTQIRNLQKEGKLDITIFSTTVPICDVRSKVPGIKFTSWRNVRLFEVYSADLIYCIGSDDFNISEKKDRLRFMLMHRFKHKYNIFEFEIIPAASKLFSKYDMVCVMSEASIFRKAASKSDCKKKIQWIHTDYCAWREKTEWTKRITEQDCIIYKKMDIIVTLSDTIRRKMINLYPELADKVTVNRNVMPVNDILNKSNNIKKNKTIIKFITVGRIDDSSKACYRLLDILTELAEDGYLFQWTFIGNGEDYGGVVNQVENSILKDFVIMKGAMKNPFPEIKKADVFALLSTYEGLPNTIYESLIIGVPVLATNVGGISDQITNKEEGWLVPNNKTSIKESIIHVLMHPEEIYEIKKNIAQYNYDNDQVMSVNDKIFSLGE